MKPDRFDRKTISVAIPDATEVSKHGLFHSHPESILPSIPPDLTPLAIDILQTALSLKSLMRQYDRKRSAIKVKTVQKVREDWERTVSVDRETNRAKESAKLRKREISELTREEKIWFKIYGVTPAEFLNSFLAASKQSKG